jgi:hypothetical protein
VTGSNANASRIRIRIAGGGDSEGRSGRQARWKLRPSLSLGARPSAIRGLKQTYALIAMADLFVI